MTDLQLNEPLIAAMMARLENGLPDAVEQNNASRTPSYPLTVPRQILAAPPTKGQLDAGLPIVALADGDITWVDDVGWGLTNVMELTVLAYDYDFDPTALAWRLRRWAQVIADVAMAGRNVELGAWGTKLKKIVPGFRLSRVDPETSQVQTLGWVAVVITAMNEDVG